MKMCTKKSCFSSCGEFLISAGAGLRLRQNRRIKTVSPMPPLRLGAVRYVATQSVPAAAAPNETFIIRSALWDIREGSLVLFVDCPNNSASLIKQCIFSKASHDATPSLAIGDACRAGTVAAGGGWMVGCGSQFPKRSNSESVHDLQAYVSLRLSNNQTVPRKAAEVIDDKLRGDAVVCTRALTALPSLHNFLDHYRAMGVDHFHINYLVPAKADVQAGVGHKLYAYGGPVKIVHAQDVTWHFGGRDTHLPILAQMLQITDCVHRYKYSYRYALIIDLDEYLVLNASLRGYPKLGTILDDELSDDSVGVKICRMHYSRSCPATIARGIAARYNGAGFFYHWKRDPKPDCDYGKSIVRPSYVKAAWAHHPEKLSKKAREGVGWNDWPPSVGFFQHWSSREREGQGADLRDCDKLKAQNETFVSDIWFL